MIKKLCGRIIYRFIPLCFSQPFFKIFGGLEVKGIKNIPRKGGIIIAPNHLSYVDPPLLATVITGGCRFMARHELFDIPVLKHIVSYYAFPVKRQNPGASSIKRAIRELAEGMIVVIFPEGSRNISASRLQPKNGIGMIASICKVKIVPALIEGTDKLLPQGALLPRPAKIRVTFGMPIDVSEAGNDYENIGQYIMDRIKDISKYSMDE